MAVSMEMAVFWVASTSEKLINFYQTTQHDNPEEAIFRSLCCSKGELFSSNTFLRNINALV
jgi:hypothetical protein